MCIAVTVFLKTVFQFVHYDGAPADIDAAKKDNVLYIDKINIFTEIKLLYMLVRLKKIDIESALAIIPEHIVKYVKSFKRALSSNTRDH